jgi:hypothetical protein
LIFVKVANNTSSIFTTMNTPTNNNRLCPQPAIIMDEDEGCPVTPPTDRTKKIHPLASSCPPEAPKQRKPINRRLHLQEAQERLSLPDLFAPRPATSPLEPTGRRTRGMDVIMGRQQMMLFAHQQLSQNSLRIQPKAVPWGDYYDNASHSISQRSIDPFEDAI